MSVVARRINELLWLWVLVAIALGLLFPGVVHLAPFSVLLLAGIVAGVAATLDVHTFRLQKVRPLLPWLVTHVLMIAWAWALGRLLGLDPVHQAGLVLLGASTPDLTAPLLSRLARGATHSVVLLLVAAGALSLLLLPLSATLLIDNALDVPLTAPLRVVLLGVLVPTVIGLGVHHTLIARRPSAQEGAALVSTVSTVLVTAAVAAVNRDTILSPATGSLLPLLVAALLLFGGGLLMGHLAGHRAQDPLRRGCLFIPGTREYALAAAIVLAVGLPHEAALLPLFFGAIQMVLAPILAHRMGKTARSRGGGPTG